MKSISFVSKMLIRIFIIGLGSVGLLFGISYLLGAPPIANDYVSIIYDENGQPLESVSGYNEKIPLEEITPYLVQATVSAEDRKFFYASRF